MRFFLLRNMALRLRVVGASDTEADQSTKLRVRDAILPVARKTPFSVRAIACTARDVDPTARVRVGLLRFGGYCSPAVQVTLGAGAGHNWWGILYPQASGIGEDPVEFDSWLLKLLRSWGWI